MRTVYKYEVPLDDVTGFEAPAGARILHLGPGPNARTLYAWALVDLTQISEPVELRIAGTGHPLPEQPGEFLQTVIAPPFVWHVWRRGR